MNSRQGDGMIPAGSSDEFKAGYRYAEAEGRMYLLCEKDRVYELGYQRRGEGECDHTEYWQHTYQWGGDIPGCTPSIITVCQHCNMVLFAEVM